MIQAEPQLLYVQYISPFALLGNAAVWYEAAERLDGSKMKEGERSQGIEKAFEPTTCDREELDKKRGFLKSQYGICKTDLVPNSEFQESSSTAGTRVSQWQCPGRRKRRRKRRRRRQEGSRHSFAKSKYVSKGTVTAELSVRLSAGAESHSQTSPDFLSQSFYTRLPAMAFPALGDWSKSPACPTGSEIHSRQRQCSSF